MTRFAAVLRSMLVASLLSCPLAARADLPLQTHFVVTSDSFALEPYLGIAGTPDQSLYVLVGSSEVTLPFETVYFRAPDGSAVNEQVFVSGACTISGIDVAVDADGGLRGACDAPNGPATSIPIFGVDDPLAAATVPFVAGVADGAQLESYGAPAIDAATTAGGYVVAFEASDAGSVYWDQDIVVQRFDATDTAAGSLLDVNTTRTDDQVEPDVATDPDGNFVVVWTSDASAGGDASGTSIQGQRFDSTGSPLGSEFQVNTTTSGDQSEPVVEMAPSGSFVVVWKSAASAGTDASGTSIQAQRYSAAGTPVGSEFQVNTTTLGDQSSPDISMRDGGSFLVVWQDDLSDADGRARGQAFDAGGTLVDSEFAFGAMAGTYAPKVTALATGHFAVVGYRDGQGVPPNDFDVLVESTYSEIVSLTKEAGAPVNLGAGDEIEYTLTFDNPLPVATDPVVLTDSPDGGLSDDNGTLLVEGSVTTTQGTIVEGNGPGDTQVEVDLGVVPANSQAIVTFRSTVKTGFVPTPLWVENQASALGIASDHPSTGPVGDPTVTLVRGGIYDVDAAVELKWSDDSGYVSNPGSPGSNPGGVLPADGDFGSAIASLGDLDGDSVVDVAVGLPGADDGKGIVTIFFLNPDLTVKASQSLGEGLGGFVGTLGDDDAFGRDVAAIGDLDGDSVVDLAVGAAGDDDGDTDAGALWILFLNSNGTVKDQQKISCSEGGAWSNPLFCFFDGFGEAIAELDDLDGDGIEDIFAAGSYHHVLLLNSDGTVKSRRTAFGLDPAGGATAIGDVDGDGVVDVAVGMPESGFGHVEILFLNSDGTVKSSSYVSNGESSGDRFGEDVSALPDLDGDGLAELIVGAPGDDQVENPDGGAVHLVFLGPDGTDRGEFRITTLTGGSGGLLDSQDYLGTGVEVLGDADGDGRTEYAVGAPGDADGAVWIFSIDATTTPQELVASTTVAISDVALGGVLQDFDRFSVVEGIGDFDLDGTPDAAGANCSGVRDAIYLMSLNAQGQVQRRTDILPGEGDVTGVGPTDLFGCDLAYLGDLAGAGSGSFTLAVGAPLDDGGGADRGAVYLLFIDGQGAVVSQQKIDDATMGLLLSDGDEFGRSVAFLGDLDGAGPAAAAMAVGAPGDDTAGAGLGSVHVLFLDSAGNVLSSPAPTKIYAGLAMAGTGQSLAFLGNLDADGKPELAVGSPLEDENGTDTGAVWVFSLNADGSVANLWRIGAGDLEDSPGDDYQLGQTMDFFDGDGDGSRELAVGYGTSPNHGFFVLTLDPDTETVVKKSVFGGASQAGNMTKQTIEPRLGEIGDLDGDGVPELGVGRANFFTSGTTELGRIRVVYFVPPLPDGDSDGVADALEDAAPNGGDGNGDGLLDSAQSDVASLVDAEAGEYVTLEATGCTLSNVTSQTEAQIGVGDPAYSYPRGLVGFELPCSSAVVRLVYHGTPVTLPYRKYGPTTPGDPLTNQWYDLPGAVSGSDVIGGVGVATVTLSLSDGVLGDDTGVDGVIVDPGGAVPEPGTFVGLVAGGLLLGLLNRRGPLVAGRRFGRGAGAP